MESWSVGLFDSVGASFVLLGSKTSWRAIPDKMQELNMKAGAEWVWGIMLACFTDVAKGIENAHDSPDFLSLLPKLY